MHLNAKLFSGARDKIVNPGLQVGTWKVWEEYEEVEADGGDAYVIARENADDQEYPPLAKVPGLFLEFARLAEEDEITREIWLDWVRRYGVLGLEWRVPDETMFMGLFGPVCQEGGPTESYKNFVKEARRANWSLRLLESVVSPEGPDPARFEREREEIHGFRLSRGVPERSVDEAKDWGLGEVWHELQAQIKECYPTVLPVEEGFVQGWGFHTLISAMYLQLMWLLTASAAGSTEDAIRWCKRPECNKIIDYRQPPQPPAMGMKPNDRSMGYRTRKDKEFCNDSCRALYHYHYVRKRARPDSSR